MENVRTASPFRLDDTTRCPACSAPLGAGWCASCGLELRPPLANQLLEASVQAEHWLGERDRLIDALRRQGEERAREEQARQERAREEWARAAHARSATTAPPARPVQGPMVQGPILQGPARRGGGVQALLVGLGALMLAVAAVVFLAFSWDVLGLVGRSVVVATATVAVLAGAAWSRRAGLAATAEAVAAVGVVLVLLDAGAVYATGLFGVDAVPALRFAAFAVAVVTVLLAGFGRLARLRACTVAAAVLAPLAPVLAGSAVGDAGAGAPAFLLGLAGALLVAALRRSPLVADLVAERHTLAAGAVTATVLAVPTLAVVASQDGAWAGALSAVVLAVATATQTVGAGRAMAWSVTSGGLLGTAVCLVTAAIDPGTWLIAVMPLAVGAVALAVVAGGRAGEAGMPVLRPRGDGAAVGASVVGAVTLLPATATVALSVLGVPLLSALVPWSTTPGTSLLQALSRQGDSAGWVDAHLISTVVLASLCALAGAAVLCLAARAVTGGAWFGSATTWLVAAVAVAVPLQPQAPVWLSVATGLVLAATAGVASLTVLAPRRTAALCVAGAVGASAVVLAWTVRELSVPATLVGVAGLLLARRATTTWRAPLACLATAASLVATAAGVRWAGLGPADAVVVAGAVGAGVATATVTTPVRGPVADRGGRRAVLLPGLLAAILGVLAAGEPERSDAVPVLAQLALLLAVVAVAAWQGGSLSRTERSIAAGVVPLGTLGVALSATATWAGPEPVLVAALVAAAGAGVATALGRRRDHRRLAVELGTGAVAVLTGAWLLTGTSSPAAVLPLVVLAVAALVLASAPDRRLLAWVALSLASLAWWLRLDTGAVDVLEVYTLPVAAVLLAVAVLGTGRGRVEAGTSPSALIGAALAVVPSTLAGVVGTGWRLSAVSVTGLAALVAARAVADPRSGWRSWGPVLVGSAAVVALAGALPRALLVAAEGHDLVDGLAGPVAGGLAGQPAWTVEVWALVAAGLGVGAGLLTARVRAYVPPAGLVVLALPSLVATSGDPAGLSRSLAVVLLGGAAVLVRALPRVAPPVTAPPGTDVPAVAWYRNGLLVATGRATAALAALWGLAADVTGPAEALTVPLGLVLVTDGWLRMRERPASSSLALAPGLVVLLVPSLLLASTSTDAWRLVALAVVATVAVVVGAVRTWAAPLLIGAAVLTVHALVQLAPVAVLAYDAVPRWVTLALAGSVLLALGARYESRLADLRSLRSRLSDLR